MYFLCLHHCPLSICTFGSINVDAVSHRHRNCACFVTVWLPVVTVAAMSETYSDNAPPRHLEGHHL